MKAEASESAGHLRRSASLALLARRPSSRLVSRLTCAFAALALAALGPTRINEAAFNQSGDTSSASMRGRSVSVTPTLPDGVGSDWWTAVQAHLQAEAYAVRPVTDRAAGTFEADSPSQGWRARFALDGLAIVPAPHARDPRHALSADGGPPIASAPASEIAASGADDWTVGLRLTAYGAGDALRQVATVAPQAEGARVEFRYDESKEGTPALSEWYVNEARGIEHGFTLAVPPPGPGPVTLALAVSGGLRPALQADGNAVELRAPDGAARVRYTDLYVTDATGRTLPAMLSVPSGEPSAIHLVVDTSDAVYPVTIDPLLTTPATVLTGATTSSFFGISVATAGDVNGDGYADVVVGAYGYSSYTGRAYVFLGGPSGLATTAATTLTGEATNNDFGNSVATAGDVNGDGYADLVVGAYGHSSATGRAYVYLGGPSGLATTAATTLTGAATGDFFGWSVATAGDVNGDGYADVVVGAPRYGPDDTGRTYLHLGGAFGLATTAATTLTGEATGNQFGSSVATAGDVNGDGYSDVVIGAVRYSGRGRAYVYLGNLSGLATTAATTLTGEATGNQFGSSVATAGDVNGDGYADVVVGAPIYSQNTGRAYLYLGGASGVPTTAATTLTGEANNNLFGSSVATAGDVNGDGYADMVVGAPLYAGYTGRAHVFLGGPSGLAATAATTLTGEVAPSAFGYSVAAAGDVNGDGYPDVVVGAYGGGTGRAYVYHGAPSGSAPTISAIPNQTTPVNTAAGPIGFTVADADTAASSLALSGSSSNTALAPPSNISFGGSGANRTVTVTPAPNQAGTTTITVTVGDGALTASTTFTLTVQGSTSLVTPVASSGRGPWQSRDNRFVAFTSDLTSLVPNDTNGVSDIFVRNQLTAAIARVSVSAGGVGGNGASSSPTISRDGRFVAFVSAATNLMTGDSNRVADIFVHDRDADADGLFDEPGAISTSRASVATGGLQANGASAAPSISDDGRIVAFESLATNLVTGDANAASDIFVHDRVLNRTVRVSVTSAMTAGLGHSTAPSLSGDGRLVAFVSTAPQLVPVDLDATSDVFLHDRDGDGNGTMDEPGGVTTSLASRASAAGAKGNGASTEPSLSGDGRRFAFTSVATNLVPSDINGVADIFLVDRSSGDVRRISRGPGATEANGASAAASVNADGTIVAFESVATNLILADTNGVSDVFLFEDSLPFLRRASVTTVGEQANGASFDPSVGGTAARVVYATEATNLGSAAAGGSDAGRESLADESRTSLTSYQPAPTMQDIAPDRGPVAGGQTVTITGIGWTSNMVLTFAGSPATDIRVVSDDTLTARTPPGTVVGPVDLVLVSLSAVTASLLPTRYTYEPPSVPPCSYAVAFDGPSFAASGDTRTAAITTAADCSWAASSTADWLEVSPASGSGSAAVTITAAPQASVRRAADVMVAGQTLSIVQEASPEVVCSYTLSSTTQAVSAAGASASVQVTSPSACAWSAQSNVAWIEVTNGGGPGNAVVRFSIAPNTAAAGRTGTVAIAGQTFTVTQQGAPCLYAVSPTSLAIESGDDRRSVGVTSPAACGWTAASNAPWIRVESGATGSGTDTVSLRVEANTEVDNRSGTVTVAGQIVTLTQAGLSCTYSLSESSAAVPDAGGTVTVNVAAPPGCAWTAERNAEWLAITGGAEDEGTGTVTITVSANLEATPRSGGVTIARLPVTIDQIGTADADGDELPDSWETQFGLNATSAAGHDGKDGDPDIDGSSNIEEYQDATHPRGGFTRYLAEGASGTFFDTRIVMANATPTAISALLRFLKSDGSLVTQTVSVPPLARRSVTAEAIPDLAAAEFSTSVESDGPLVVERTMTWDRAGGYGSHAEGSVLAPALEWYLAEGATHSGFNLFYLIQNPSTAAADVEITYLRPAPAPPLVKTYQVTGSSRRNVWVNFEDPALGSSDISAVVRATNGVAVIVERAMYLNAGGLLFGAGHESAGVTAPATTWFLAEGATGSFFDLFVLIANPGTTAAEITATYLLPNGTTVTKTYTVPASSRFNIFVDLEDARLADTAVSTTITSTNGVPIIVERAMWWPGPTAATWHEAHNSPGTTQTGTQWVLADGEISGEPESKDTYILVANTSAMGATVNVTLLFEDGTAPLVRTFQVSANSRFNVHVRTAFPEAIGKTFGTSVETTGATPAQIVVERAVYSNAFGVIWAAGSNALATRVK